jgi:hypothetical protein
MRSRLYRGARVAVWICVGLWTCAQGVELATQDGLVLRVDGTTGQVNGLSVNGRELALFSGVFGGLQFYAPSAITSHSTLFHEDFNGTGITWNSAIMDDWEASETYFTWMASGGIGDSKYLRLGDGSHTGCGIAFPQAMNVLPGSSLTISWFGRSTNTESKYIFCVRLFNEDGEDITEESPVAPGWIYSAASRAQCVFGMTNEAASTWQEFSYQYYVPDEASSMTISLRYWRDGDFYVDIDELRIEVTGGIDFGTMVNVSGPVSEIGANTYQQIAELTAQQVKFTTTYSALSDHIRADVLIEDTSVPLRTRPLRIYYTVPIDAIGWKWGDDIYRSRLIEAGTTCENTFGMLDRKVSVYPWSAVYDGDSGISLAVPMDVPRIQRFAYTDGKGLQTLFDVCLSTETVHVEAGKASVSFLLYDFAPEWGFRSATKKYYEIFPQFFVKRTERDGCWEYPISPDLIPNALDFGFAYFECWPKPEEVRNYCRDLGIELYYYIEPWGAWQNYADITEKPSYEDRVGTLEEWAANTGSSATWLWAPRYYTAQAVLNSGYRDADGRYYIDAYDYFWHQWGGLANQFWPCYPDTDFSGTTMGNLFKTYMVENFFDEYDGVYVDSIVVDSSMGNIADFNPEHFEYARQPLVFSLANAQPVMASQLAQYDFLNWLSSYLHSRDKKVMGNIFSYAYRYYAHLLDILGSEVSDVSESDTIAALRRTLCYQKVNTNLLQWFRGEDFVDHAEVDQYIKGQLFWGFFPGIASCGGGIGWGESIERYFLHPELYERDRSLFRKYIPIIRELSEAGWEPLTYATVDSSDVLIERFGEWDDHSVLFTLRNDAATELSVNVAIDAQALGIAEEELDTVECVEVVSGLRVPVSIDDVNQKIYVNVNIPASDVRVMKLYPSSLCADPGQWMLFY